MVTKIVAFASLLTFSTIVCSQAQANPIATLNGAFQSMRATSQPPASIGRTNKLSVKNAESMPEEVSSSGSAFAGHRIDKVIRQLNTILQCPNRIWPGLKKDSYRVLFVQPSTKESWFWTAVSGKAESISESEFTASPKSPEYSFGQFRNERAVIINLERVSERSRIPSLNVDGAVSLAFHESFHYLFQMKEPWNAQLISADRKSDLDHVSAVYFRRMLIRALKADLFRGDGFGHSSYWFQKWEALGESPETKFSDILEGTANYAEIIASVIADKGCQVTEEELLHTAISSLDSAAGIPMDAAVMKQLFAQYKATGYQIEGYEIGLLSLLAMRMRGNSIGSNEFPMGRDFASEIQSASTHAEKMKVMNDLQEALAKVRTPAEILLRSVAPTLDQEDFGLLESIRKASIGH